MDSLPIAKIHLRADARPIDDDAVAGLVDSIREVGLINPIRVRPRPDSQDGWEVIAGAHRLGAMKQLGLKTVPAVVVHDDDLRAEMAMIDENLIRAELSAAERARQTARRKAIYLELHPETAQSANIGGPHGQFGHAAEKSFVGATSSAVGRPERTIRRDAERGEKIAGDVLAKVTGTVLDKGVELDKLKNVAPEKQEEWVDKRLAKAAAGDAPADPAASESKPAKDRRPLYALGQLKKWWREASPGERKEFIAWADAMSS